MKRFLGAGMMTLLAACNQQTPQPQTDTVDTAGTPNTTALEESVKPIDTAFPEEVYWGDQHVHTSESLDAAAGATIVTPEDAVRFARGETVKSNTGQDAKLHRPLDWIVISDHSDAIGVMEQVKKGNPELIADEQVNKWHIGMNGNEEQTYKAALEVVLALTQAKLPEVMKDPKFAAPAWQKSVDTMEKYNEPGKFTAFIGFEWTSSGDTGQNLHRNVVFREGSEKTRDEIPLSTFKSFVPGRSGTDPESLWAWLADWEDRTGGHALAIPHNGNMSNGWMFREARYDGAPMTPEWAAARARWEVLYEIFQYKGAGETHPSLSMQDEFADFEIWDTSDLPGHAKPEGAIEHEYARQALSNGMRLEDELGVNPFKFGLVSGTDTHTGLPSGGEEDNFWGKFLTTEPRAERWSGTFNEEENYLRKEWTMSVAGVTGVWATSNTRGAVWDAMKRRETYASSGPRIKLRFFAGYDFAESDATGDIAANGYAKGVPMGGDLDAAVDGQVPTFLFAASKDPTGANLDRLQIIKGWVDADGNIQEKVFDAAWSDQRKPGADGKLPAVGNTVDLKTAKFTNSIGSPELVGSFRDPDFDPSLKAFYYARAIEIPTPRWTAYDAVKFDIEMDPEVTMIIQERAVSSPVWYHPQGDSVAATAH